MLPAVPSDRERHQRAICYLLVSLGLALAGYAFLGFARFETVAYGAAVYVFLNALNYRSMFSRPAPVRPAPRHGQDGPDTPGGR